MPGRRNGGGGGAPPPPPRLLLLKEHLSGHGGRRANLRSLLAWSFALPALSTHEPGRRVDSSAAREGSRGRRRGSARCQADTRLGAALARTLLVKPTILVAEDDADLRATLCDALTSRWMGVTAVGSGREARDCLRFDPAPAVIVLDLRLPDGDGWTLLRWLHDQQALRHVPVVILSGAPYEHVELALVGRPSITYLPKPVGLVELSAAIRSAVGAPCDESA